jgi:rhamnulokinase
MNKFYVACDFDVDSGRVMMGTLDKGRLTMSEIRRFANEPIQEKDSLQWNIPQLYQETLIGLREISQYEEPVDSISCDSWAADYLMFESDGSLITPTYHGRDPRTTEGMQEVFSKISWETIYDETGIQKEPANTLFQLGAEKSRRLKRANHIMPIADGFNYLLAGVPRIEMSLASATQLYNPITKTWSDRVLDALHLSPKLFPPVVAAGTKLGMLRADIAKETGLEDAQVVTSCSHELAAALLGLPVDTAENWAYLRLGTTAVMGTELVGPIISDVSRELNFTNEIGFGGSVHFDKHQLGLWIYEECQRYWRETDRELDPELLTHLAICAPPFESLINPADPRFQTPGDMPLKIQAFCKETNQAVPRKPGPITRCVFESLALMYRRTLQEIKYLTGRKIARLYLLGDSGNSLLNNFIANALRIPVVIAPPDTAAMGNVVGQALALGHVESLAHAREILCDSFKTETITPQVAAWDAAYYRLAELVVA